MQRFRKTYSYFGQYPERKGNISPSNFDGQLPNTLFTCFCVRAIRVVAVANSIAVANSKVQEECIMFDGTLNSMLGGT